MILKGLLEGEHFSPGSQFIHTRYNNQQRSNYKWNTYTPMSTNQPINPACHHAEN